MSGNILPPVTADDIVRMRNGLFIADVDRPRRASRFWVLLVLAAVIATAGVIADSTATVIGAMIVAPLMTPILGTALALVLADRRNLLASIAYTAAGAGLVVVIAYTMGILDILAITSDTNSQVAARVSPQLIDLIAALATGAVGAFAVIRSDISDALPGVAIAISLVPPLAVVGLTLESGEPGEAAGAALLFATNVAAIVATGTLVFLRARVRGAAFRAGAPVGQLRRKALVPVLVALLLVAVPLTVGTVTVIRAQLLEQRVAAVARDWAESVGWQIRSVDLRQETIVVVAIGPPPAADADRFRTALDDAGLDEVTVEVTLLVGGTATIAPTDDQAADSPR
jgi:uncharacterized hydrophobic protein (TIGR00271 family)